MLLLTYNGSKKFCYCLISLCSSKIISKWLSKITGETTRLQITLLSLGKCSAKVNCYMKCLLDKAENTKNNEYYIKLIEKAASLPTHLLRIVDSNDGIYLCECYDQT